MFLAFEIDVHIHYSLLPYSLDASGFHLFPCALHLIFIQLITSGIMYRMTSTLF